MASRTLISILILLSFLASAGLGSGAFNWCSDASGKLHVETIFTKCCDESSDCAEDEGNGRGEPPQQFSLLVAADCGTCIDSPISLVSDHPNAARSIKSSEGKILGALTLAFVASRVPLSDAAFLSPSRALTLHHSDAARLSLAVTVLRC